ncbi:hypothetical protein RRG08_037059 [Elysia crispata]|uniref:Uncharacterized protein n=1 Tax=Elysia crispata TaxID=231223 RepID=A0AAE1E1V4_9GAST|nr:hypothetical protein RRG08_037059 [Elysia crispata]
MLHLGRKFCYTQLLFTDNNDVPTGSRNSPLEIHEEKNFQTEKRASSSCDNYEENTEHYVRVYWSGIKPRISLSNLERDIAYRQPFNDVPTGSRRFTIEIRERERGCIQAPTMDIMPRNNVLKYLFAISLIQTVVNVFPSATDVRLLREIWDVRNLSLQDLRYCPWENSQEQRSTPCLSHQTGATFRESIYNSSRLASSVSMIDAWTHCLPVVVKMLHCSVSRADSQLGRSELQWFQPRDRDRRSRNEQDLTRRRFDKLTPVHTIFTRIPDCWLHEQNTRLTPHPGADITWLRYKERLMFTGRNTGVFFLLLLISSNCSLIQAGRGVFQFQELLGRSINHHRSKQVPEGKAPSLDKIKTPDRRYSHHRSNRFPSDALSLDKIKTLTAFTTITTDQTGSR